MLGQQDRRQGTLFVAGSLEDLIPDDHILKRVDKILDLSWLREEVQDCYSDSMGRPGVDPAAAVRLMLAGFFHGIVHDRKLMREAQVNLAIRWFSGYRLDEPLPDHSSLTRIRQRWGAERFCRIFQKTVQSCIQSGLVSGETVHMDATLIRADVSWESLTAEHAEKVLEENLPEEQVSDGAPPQRGRPRTRPRFPKKHSRTDPDATMATSRKDQRLEPSYKQHTAVDDRAGVILDVDLTTGEVNEGRQLLSTLDRVEGATGKAVQRLTADGSYAHPTNYAALEERGTDLPVRARTQTGAIVPPMPERKKWRKIPTCLPVGRYVDSGMTADISL